MFRFTNVRAAASRAVQPDRKKSINFFCFSLGSLHRGTRLRFFLVLIVLFTSIFYKKRIDEKKKKVFPVNPKQGFVFTFSVSVLIYASPIIGCGID